MPLPEIIFVHIPKTGGGTLRRIFSQAYKDQLMYDRTFRRDRKKWGFVLLGSSLAVRPNGYQDYKFIIGHFNYEKYAHLNRPTVTFLRHPMDRIHSYYTVWTRRPQFKDGTVEQFCKLCPNYMTYMTGGDLSKFAFVGLTEYFDESILRINSLFGINLTTRYKKYHVSSDKRRLSRNEVATIRKYNIEDIKLYEQAKQRFFA